MKKLLYFIPLVLCMAAAANAKTVDRIVAQVNDDIITLSDLNREMTDIRQDLATKYTGAQLEQEIRRADEALRSGKPLEAVRMYRDAAREAPSQREAALLRLTVFPHGPAEEESA